MNILLTFSRANLLNGLKPATHFAALATLLMAVLLLAACGGGGGSSGSSGGGGASGIQVTNLKAIPGSGSLTLTWDNPNANISSFDIEVRNLATNERVAAASQVNRTISSNPAVNTTAPLAAARYTIPSGLINDSNYSVAVTVNLQGADAGRAASARGLSGRRYLPANGVRIGANTDEDQYADSVDNCPAIKNDDQANTYGGADNIGDVCGDIDSDTIVDADDNCAVKYNPTQADTNVNGIGDACDSAINSDGDSIANDRDNCPLIANSNQEDGDRDNVGDICDVDADGNGLIELNTAAELNMMRYNLAGTGLDNGTTDNDNNAGGNRNGCGGLNRITTCNGYEQMADIDLNDLGQDASGSNWEPIGTCGSGGDCDVSTNAQLFSGMFSGNNFTISNLLINVTTRRYGVGFFGAISSTAQLQNVHIRGGNITTDAGVISSNVGGLVGRGDDATISNSSVTLAAISGRIYIGGLVGRGDDAIIDSSVATVGAIIGSENIGGLVGRGFSMNISSSVATVGSISTVETVSSLNTGTDNFLVGGLVGTGDSAIISSSVATVGFISGTATFVGGLAGNGANMIINSSVAIVGSISGDETLGGLLGTGNRARISYSFAVTNSINSTGGVGGWIAQDFNIITPTASYWDSKVVDSDGVMILANNDIVNNKTTAELQNPVIMPNSDGSFPAGIYAEWDNAYCNPNTGEYRATAPNPLGDFIRVWDLGTSTEYPAITCVGNLFSLEQQRAAAARVVAGESPIQ